MLPISTKTRLQAVLNAALDKTCTIERQNADRGEFGELLHNWQAVATDVSCRLIDAQVTNNSELQTTGNQEIMLQTARLILPAGTAIDVNYRVIIAGVIYNVIAIVDSRSEAIDTQAVIMRER